MNLADFFRIGWFHDPDTHDHVLLGPNGHAILFHSDGTWSHRILSHPVRTPVLGHGRTFDELARHLLTV